MIIPLFLTPASRKLSRLMKSEFDRQGREPRVFLFQHGLSYLRFTFLSVVSHACLMKVLFSSKQIPILLRTRKNDKFQRGSYPWGQNPWGNIRGECVMTHHQRRVKKHAKTRTLVDRQFCLVNYSRLGRWTDWISLSLSLCLFLLPSLLAFVETPTFRIQRLILF